MTRNNTTWCPRCGTEVSTAKRGRVRCPSCGFVVKEDETEVRYLR